MKKKTNKTLNLKELKTSIKFHEKYVNFYHSRKIWTFYENESR